MSEVRLIDANALKEAIRKRLGISSLKYLTEQEKVIVEEINNALTVKTYCYFCGQTEHGKIEEIPQGDLISRSEAEKLGATCLARRNENGQLEAIINLDNSPTVEQKYYERIVAQINPVIEARPTGEWVDYSNEGYVECPFCGSATNCEDNKDELHYCWNCGAKMKGSAE